MIGGFRWSTMRLSRRVRATVGQPSGGAAAHESGGDSRCRHQWVDDGRLRRRGSYASRSRRSRGRPCWRGDARCRTIASRHFWRDPIGYCGVSVAASTTVMVEPATEDFWWSDYDVVSEYSSSPVPSRGHDAAADSHRSTVLLARYAAPMALVKTGRLQRGRWVAGARADCGLP